VVVVAERRAEDTRLLVVGVGPRDHEIIFALLAARQGCGGVQKLSRYIVVKLFVDGLPIRQSLGDWTGLVHIGHFNWQLLAMSGRLETGELEPGRHLRPIRAAIAVHAAVQNDAWKSLAM